MRDKVHQRVVETLPGSWAPPGSRRIELVFRTIGERTSELSLELALTYIKPDRVHMVYDRKPFTLAVGRMLEIAHQCSHVVYLDASCLILEELRPFLDANELPYVDCYGRDRFQGRTHGGMRIVRIDVVRAIRATLQSINDTHFILYDEAHLCGMALKQLRLGKQYKSFYMLHDYFQHHTDIFAKYAYRELITRFQGGFQRKCLEHWMSCWRDGADFDVARHAVHHAACTVAPDATSRQLERYVRDLPHIAEHEMRKLGLSLNQAGPVGIEEVAQAVTCDPVRLGDSPKTFKVFGLGLSRTGTHSLTRALHVLGLDTVHYPTDRGTLETLIRGDARFPLLKYYDGITDVTCSPYYEDLDQAWPGSKFVLTVRDEDSWLRSCRNHWATLSAVMEGQGEEDGCWFEITRFLEAAVYGSYEFEEDHFRRVYRRYVQNVTTYFVGRGCDLLVLDIVAGEGYERLAPFLGVAMPEQPFPHEAKWSH